jgi:hypothetical protein
LPHVVHAGRRETATDEATAGKRLDSKRWPGFKHQRADQCAHQRSVHSLGFEIRQNRGGEADQQRPHGPEKRYPSQCYSQQNEQYPVRAKVAQVIKVVSTFPQRIDNQKRHESEEQECNGALREGRGSLRQGPKECY